MEELEFAESELDRAQHRAAELERKNERLRDENQELQRDLERVKRGHFELANANEILSSRFLTAQCRIARLEARVATAEASAKGQCEAEMAMARKLIGGLEKECANYENRVAALKRQLARLHDALETERARR